MTKNSNNRCSDFTKKTSHRSCLILPGVSLPTNFFLCVILSAVPWGTFYVLHLHSQWCHVMSTIFAPQQQITCWWVPCLSNDRTGLHNTCFTAHPRHPITKQYTTKIQEVLHFSQNMQSSTPKRQERGRVVDLSSFKHTKKQLLRRSFTTYNTYIHILLERVQPLNAVL